MLLLMIDFNCICSFSHRVFDYVHHINDTCSIELYSCKPITFLKEKKQTMILNHNQTYCIRLKLRIKPKLCNQ